MATTPTAATRRRMPAEQRREEVVVAASEVIARDGMHAASTAEIARRSGMSHAYLFRLFATKDELLVAVARASTTHVRREMSAAGTRARAAGEDPLEAMAACWTELLTDRTTLQLCLQGISAAASIPAVGVALREEWEQLMRAIERTVPEVGPDRLREFTGVGMLCMVVAGLQAGEDRWVQHLYGGPLLAGACEPPKPMPET